MYLNSVREVGAQCLTPDIYASEISDPVQLALLLTSRIPPVAVAIVIERFPSSAQAIYDNDLKEQ